MKTVKFKDLPEKVQAFMHRSNGVPFLENDNITLDSIHTSVEWKKATDEERLAYTEWKYQKLTKFRTLNLFEDGGQIITSDGRFKIKSTGVCCDGWFLYYTGAHSQDPTQVHKWAEIIEEPVADIDNTCDKEESKKPEFQPGEMVEVRDDDNTWSRRKYAFYANGKHWTSAPENETIAMTWDEIRKIQPDPDQKYKDKVFEIMAKYDLVKEGAVNADQFLAVMEALKTNLED